MAEQPYNWSVVSDHDNSTINPLNVTRGTPPVRSRNQSSTITSSTSSIKSGSSQRPPISPRMRHSSEEYDLKAANNLEQKMLSKVAIANVLDKQEEGLKLLSSDALLNQKRQMKVNNEELGKYLYHKNLLEDKIKNLQKENLQLRQERHGGEKAEPDYKPQSHKKQKIVNQLRDEIYNSQKNHDIVVEDINKINSKTKIINNEINEKVEKAENLQNERENQQRKQMQCKLQIPPKEDLKSKLQNDIAKNEEDFQNTYSQLLKQLAEIKPIDIPEEMLIPPGSVPNDPQNEIQQRYLDNLKKQMLKIRKEIQEINENLSKREELAKLKDDKLHLEKNNISMNRQSDLLEKKINAITDESIDVKRHAAAKKAEVDSLKAAYSEELKDHEDKMRHLHREYKTLYDKYYSLEGQISDQKERALQHKSIKEELEVMRKLLKMNRMSISEQR